MFEFLFDFIRSMGTIEFIIVMAAFGVFIYFSKKFIKTLITALWVVIASALFPVILIKVFNYPMELSVGTIFSFVTMGLALFIVYLYGKLIYKGLSILEKVGKAFAYPFTYKRKKKKEKMDKKVEKFFKEKEKEEKAAEKESNAPKIVGKKKKDEEEEDEDYLVIKEPKEEEKKK